MTFGYRYCQLCKRGHQCQNKDQEPQICPEGTYAGIGQIECFKCPEDMYCAEGSSTPSHCPPEEPDCLLKRSYEITDPERRNLQACTSGTYWDGTQCLTCPEGYRCSGGASNPVRCTQGTQYSSTGANSCTVSLIKIIKQRILTLFISHLNLHIYYLLYLNFFRIF